MYRDSGAAEWQFLAGRDEDELLMDSFGLALIILSGTSGQWHPPDVQYVHMYIHTYTMYIHAESYSTCCIMVSCMRLC